MGLFYKDGKLKITINAKDAGRHNKPHVHVTYAGKTVPVDFDGNVLGTKKGLPRKQMKKVREVLARSQRQLYESWRRALTGESFEPLEVREERRMYESDRETKAREERPELPKVVAARALSDHRMWLCLSTGEERVFDFKPLLAHKSYAPIKDRAMFEKFYIDNSTIVWDVAEPSIFLQDGDFVMWDDGRIELDCEDIYGGSVPAPEDALPLGERARALLEGIRRMNELSEYYSLLHLVEGEMPEDEFNALINDNFDYTDKNCYREMADRPILEKAWKEIQERDEAEHSAFVRQTQQNKSGTKEMCLSGT